ncbi:MAG TPA: right-handed parallel beta-helix repeat-containing protein [Candidatus Hydrogenedentes bacterium]|nr:right-handed parallel beta-helix repeat-containing protein [Candidatus Hydrogenedentota bacterium]
MNGRLPSRFRTFGALVLVGACACTGLSCGHAEPSAELRDAVRDYSSALPVFPGAEGFGTNTRAGRGGQVICVTSLDASGPGSLREAILTAGPRTIVFDVGGVIDLADVLVIAEPYVTIAGQTAPNPGITILGAGILVHTHDVLIQHLRVRVGDRENGPDPGGRDGISVVGRPDGTAPIYNVVVDHCSVSWAIDEGVSTWHPGVHDVTFRQCIIAENLSRSIHPEHEHSKGLLIGDHSKRIAVIGNFFAHNRRRNPFVKGDVSALIVNNFIYNPGSATIHFGDLERSGPSLGTVIGNAMVAGADTSLFNTMIAILIDARWSGCVAGMDNLATGARFRRHVFAPWIWRDLDAYADAPVRVTPLTIRSGAEVRAWVLEHAGARPAQRDEADLRIVDSARNRTGCIINSPRDVGGWPHAEPQTIALDWPEDPAADTDGDGYTDVEERLHELAAQVEGLS